MFKLDVSPTYFAPVNLKLLSADGVLENHQFDARFKRLNQADVDQLMLDAVQKKVKDEPLLRQYLVGWRGVKDADDIDIPFTPDELDKLLAINGLRAAMAEAFMLSLDPQESAALSAKN